MLSRGPCLFLFATVMNTLTLSFLSAGSNTSTCWVTLWQACRDKLCIIVTQVLVQNNPICTMAQVFPQQHMVTLVDMSSRHLTIKQYNYCFLPKVSYTMAGNIAKSMMSELGYNVTVDVITHKMLTTHCDIFEHIKVFLWLYHLMIGSWGN